MSKHDAFADYPARGLRAAEASLLTIWPGLTRYHDELVLVGGLAVHYLTRRDLSNWPGAVTMDVDFGIALGAGGDQYGSLFADLSGLGFRSDRELKNRLVRRVDGMALFVDFLTEDPPAKQGSRQVDDVSASVIPGINRALISRRMVKVTGSDVYGGTQSCQLAVADIGPLLVLKLNAFGGPTGRRHPKDAYDVLLAVTSFVDGPMAAIEGFQAEEKMDNQGFQTAIEALRRDFSDFNADGPIRAAHFLRGTMHDEVRIREELVTVAKFLLGK